MGTDAGFPRRRILTCLIVPVFPCTALSAFSLNFSKARARPAVMKRRCCHTALTASAAAGTSKFSTPSLELITSTAEINKLLVRLKRKTGCKEVEVWLTPAGQIGGLPRTDPDRVESILPIWRTIQRILFKLEAQIQKRLGPVQKRKIFANAKKKVPIIRSLRTLRILKAQFKLGKASFELGRRHAHAAAFEGQICSISKSG